MPEQYLQERKGKGRRKDDCPVEGCDAVIKIRNSGKVHNYKLNIIMTGILGCVGLLGVQQYQIPGVKADSERSDAALSQRVAVIEACQTSDRKLYEYRITELKELISENLTAIKKRPGRSVHTTTTITRSLNQTAKEPAEQHEIWRPQR